MGIFGEAIHGHIGYYKTSVYGAAYVSDAADRKCVLRAAQGINERNVNNVILNSASVGPNDSENQIIMLDPDNRGILWSLRTAAQTDSQVSAGYSHIAYWQSTLSAFRDIELMIYFPFMDGNECKELLKDDSLFNPSRWSYCEDGACREKKESLQALGQDIYIPSKFLKKIVCYILGKQSTKSRKFLYILVPQGVPYQAYCKVVIEKILSVIPVGMRKGISFATNPAQKDEENFGIIFQQELNSVRHGCDISFHFQGDYNFLNDYYLEKSIEKLVNLMVDNPEMVEKCYEEMEYRIYQDTLPENYGPYESYYGISQLHVNRERPEYLADCERLLTLTRSTAQQHEQVKNAISSVLISDSVCLEFIKRDRDYISAGADSSINDYLIKRRNLIEFLGSSGINFRSLCLYDKCEQFCRQNNKNTAADVYEEIVRKKNEFSEATDDEKEAVCRVAWEKAWEEFADNIPEYTYVPEYVPSEKSVLYTLDDTNRLLNAYNPESRWRLKEAQDQYERLTAVAPVNPPESMILWRRKIKRVDALSKLIKLEKSGNLESYDIEKIKNWLNQVFETDPESGRMEDSLEARSALYYIENLYSRYAGKEDDPIKAANLEGYLIEIHRICKKMYETIKESENRLPYEEALFQLMRSYLSKYDEPDTFSHAVDIWKCLKTEVKDKYLDYINQAAAERIRDTRVDGQKKIDIYNAVKGGTINPQLWSAYEEWAISEYANQSSSSELLEKVYANALKPSQAFKNTYKKWRDSDRERRRVEEIITSSKTFVRYLAAILDQKGEVDVARQADLRTAFWAGLTPKERDLSAFLGAVSLLKNRDPIEFFSQGSQESSKLRDEYIKFVDMDDRPLGLLLTRDETLQELYQRVLTYEKLSKGARKIPLYIVVRTENQDSSRKGEPVPDYQMRDVDFKFFGMENLKKTLYRLIMIQNKLLSEEDEITAVKNLKNPKAEEIVDCLQQAGVLPDNSDRVENLPEDNTKVGIKKFFPYIGLAAGLLIVFIVIAGILWRMKSTEDVNSTAVSTEKVVTSSTADESADRSVASGAERADNSNSVKEKPSKKTTSKGSATDDSAGTTPAVNTNSTASGGGTSNGEDSGNTGIEGRTPEEPEIIDGKLITHRPKSDNVAAIVTNDGYDLNDDGRTDLFVIFNDNSMLEGLGLNQSETVDIKAIWEDRMADLKDPHYLAGYDIDNDGRVDGEVIWGDPDKPDDPYNRVGFDFDEDGMCDINFEFQNRKHPDHAEE